MSHELRVGLIGLGTAGLRHAAAIGRGETGRVVAVADPAPEAGRVAAEHGFTWFPDHDAMLDRVDLDAVIISVPHALLPAAALAAARRGKHVLLEKPMATTTAEAKQVVRACRAARVRLMVNFVHRFRPEYRRAWELLRSGVIGRPVVAMDVMATGRREMPAWVWDEPIAGGGMMMYGGVHSIDRLAWLMASPAASVAAAMGTFSYPVEVEDNLVGTVTFESGGLGVVVHHRSTATRTLAGWHTLVYGTRGAMKLVSGRELIVESETEQIRVPGEPEDRFLGAFEEFSAAIRDGREPAPSGEDGLRALDTTLALYTAARTRSRVALGGVPPPQDLNSPPDG